jgi:hemerythrin
MPQFLQNTKELQEQVVNLEKHSIFWTEQLSVGIEKIDEQHKKLIEIYDSVSNIKSALAVLTNYAKYHFLEEQEILNKKVFTFSYKEFHEEEHALFIRKVDKFLKGIETNETHLEDICKFLKDWISIHVTKVDSKLQDGKERDNLVGPMMAHYLRGKV